MMDGHMVDMAEPQAVGVWIGSVLADCISIRKASRVARFVTRSALMLCFFSYIQALCQ